jgi:hypothetical protein
MEWKARLLAIRSHLSASAHRHPPSRAISGRRAFIESWAYARSSVSLSLASVLRDNLLERLSLKLGKLQIVEHDSDKFFEGDVGLKGVNARLIAALAALTLSILIPLLNHIARLLLPVTLRDTWRVLTVDEAIFLNGTDWNLDYLVAVTTDNRLLR